MPPLLVIHTTARRNITVLSAGVEEIVSTGDWRRRLEELAGRRRDSWVLGGVVGVAVFGSYLMWGRPAPAKIAPPASASTASYPDATPSAALLLVHVAGAVRHPGLYEFAIGARVADAIATAGGAQRFADLSALNLAELLIDGSRVDVPRRGQRTAPESSLVSPSPSSPTIDINTADQAALETIPGVGPVTALAILQHRDAIGGFQDFEDLLDVDGIGPATLESIRPYIAL